MMYTIYISLTTWLVILLFPYIAGQKTNEEENFERIETDPLIREIFTMGTRHCSMYLKYFFLSTFVCIYQSFMLFN